MTKKELFVKIAEGELGTEAPKGDDKYIEWYGGFNNDVPWCAIFVSWCAHMAGLGEESVPKHASCTLGRSKFREMGRFHSPGSYIPEPGDLVYFDWDKTGDCDHVGIVKSANAISFTTIEGNSANAVRQRIYLMKNDQIAGFAEVKEPIDTLSEAIDKLSRVGVINSPDYWKKNHSKLQYVDELIIKFARKL
jgi:hypothetical protein